ncbi:MAG TPA: dATP/dGTP diphosphohydrolase domain-containing protein [Castellaniella sp.]|nr:dATP/dGTP diphosphohydrolase domain-containing protein [Castellaniella sp.]
MSEARKDDAAKPRMDLIPPEALFAMAGVLTHGADKYSKRYESICHAILSAPFVTEVVVSTPKGSVAAATKKNSERVILTLQKDSDKIGVTGKPGTQSGLESSLSVVCAAQRLESVMQQLNGQGSCEIEGSHKMSTTPGALAAARYAATRTPESFTLTIVTSQGRFAESFAVSAITVSECWATMLRGLKGLSPTFAGHDFEIEVKGERNWERGMDRGRIVAALLRHLSSWMAGENNDRDSGMPHSWHVLTNAAFLVAHEVRDIGTDTRSRT